MSLTSGSRLGPYEVGSPLGAGGMGQVYRARDTQLGRDVAIKALPDAMANDPERVARFQREAQVLASLNHPNIAGIHGLQEADGHKYLVLEFVDGLTLGEHITRVGAGKGLPLADALPIVREIIDALEAAHDKGIVHRDLKPANIMMTAEGHAKVLDFGLARVVGSDAGASTADSPTFTMAATQAGTILGTAAYMSPEQAKGKVADKRSDVWSFGCVFYEMLTGKRLFDAEDVSETLAAVLRGEPDWAALPAGLPVGVRSLVQRCLERDRKRRIPEMSVVRFMLDEALAAPAAPAVASPTGSGRSRPLWLAAAVVGGIALIAIGAWGITALAPAPAPAPLLRFSISPPASQRLAPTLFDRQLALSPDGQLLVYVSGDSRVRGQLMVRRLDQVEATPLTGAIGLSPFFSPDGQWIAYFDRGQLHKVPSSGGPSTTVCQLDGQAFGGTWTKGNVIVFATRNPSTGLQSVSANGGTPTNLTTPATAQGEVEHLLPWALPDGSGVLFTVDVSGPAIGNSVAMVDLRSGEQRVLLTAASGAQFVEPGYLLYAAGTVMQAVRFDLASRAVLGEPAPLAEQVAVLQAGVGQLAVSQSGMLVYIPSGALEQLTDGDARTIVWVNREGREEPIVGLPPRVYFALRVSPDGTRMALDVRDQESDIWIWDFARRTLDRLTFDPGGDAFPVWTPDSRRVIFGSSRTGPINLYAQSADGTGATERLGESPHTQAPGSVLPDGSGVLYTQTLSPQYPNIFLAELSAKGTDSPVLNSPATERLPQISPDGRFIAFDSDETTRMEIYVRPFPDVNGGRWRVSTAGGSKPVWSPAGGELFYHEENSNTLMVVPVQTSPSFKVGTPTRLFAASNVSSLASALFYDAARDGKRFVMIKELPPKPGAPTESAGPTFVVVVNWLESLKAALKGK